METKTGRKVTDFAADVTRYLRDQNYYPHINNVDSSVTNSVMSGGKECTNFYSNSFLGIADHPKIIEAGHRALDQYGAGTGSARLVATTDVHRKLEERIALFKHREDAVVFSAGMLANWGIIPALASSPLRNMVTGLGGGDLFESTSIFIDKYSHSCIIDAGSLCSRNFWGNRASVKIYEHMDMVNLRDLLEKDDNELKIIITDGVFSIHGRIAPLDEIVKLAAEFNAAVYVDDAHGTGVLGPTGRGTAELLGVDQEIDIPVGTLSKALSICGGFVVGGKDFCDYIRIASRTYVFQTAMPPSDAAQLIAAFDVIESETWRRETLQGNSEKCRRAIEDMGFSTLGSQHHIIPVLIGDEVSATLIADELMQEGIIVGCIRYPAIDMGEAVLRCNMMATHTESQLDKLISNLQRLGKKHGII